MAQVVKIIVKIVKLRKRASSAFLIIISGFSNKHS